MKATSLWMILGLLAVAALVSGCTQVSPPLTVIPEGAIIVEISSSGFSPSTVTVNAGDTVAWLNKDNTSHWPASAAHPTHSVYPEMGGCTNSKFDACKALAQGEVFAFTFNKVGEWKYHDHLNCCTNPAFFGTVVVK